jgi:hypothetical protein
LIGGIDHEIGVIGAFLDDCDEATAESARFGSLHAHRLGNALLPRLLGLNPLPRDDALQPDPLVFIHSVAHVVAHIAAMGLQLGLQLSVEAIG